MLPTDSLQLTPKSTLADLPTHDFQVESSVLGEAIATEFQNRPELPGVLITENSRVMGMISRRKFLEQMSQPYSLELYLRRPVRVLLEVLEVDPLRLPSNSHIDVAVRQALSRPTELLYEPIIIQKGKELRLLELHILLLAQSQIFAQINSQIYAQKEEARQYANSLKQEQDKVKEYASRLRSEQLEVQRRNQILELQRAKLAQQKQEIVEQNERLVRIGNLLSVEGKRIFAELLASVDEICNSTARIVDIGKGLSYELETVSGATQLIERVSQQVRHLSIQAALIANRAQGESGNAQLAGFSNITKEIGSLGSKTFEATNQVNQISSRFKFQIGELMNAARRSEDVARLLLKHSKRTQEALNELEHLLSEHNQQAQSPPEAVKV